MTQDAGGGAVAADTSLQRTYRYLRLGVAGTAVAIAVAVGVAVPDVGVLESISAYYYTAAQVAFVGALIAASLGLLALSGRGPQRALLDAAALLAPLVAVIPTPVFAIADAPGCGGVPCVPASVHPAIDNGIVTYLIVGALAVVVAVLLGVRADAGGAALSRTWPSIVVAVVVLAGVWAWWALGRESFVGFGHGVATTGFFGILAVVALLDALRTDWAPEPPPSQAVRVGYAVIAVLMAADLLVVTVFVAVGRPAASDFPLVFVCEFAALALFCLYWVLRTTQTWDQPDPALVGAG
ncbi:MULTISPECIES: hypothetical protein [unclassified Microbacterium]|uniref:hypothetical protein n=1 Tax=unclassified Microbacterium TaxID=2609290 RepID=UPI00214B1EFC|nr:MULTISPECIES: hypothetical protein [unclassified Microbacterium]MCR2783872.1 hypothetical protein [Microbacterium sp. zg.B96]WIM15282.1 hypothetical protein QNO11_12120 [Microbacterium sp. zg-B96]